MKSNPRDGELESSENSSDVGDDISSRVKQVKAGKASLLGDKTILISSRCLESTWEPQKRLLCHRDNGVQLYTLSNGVTGKSDGPISLEVIPSLSDLLELDELS